MPYVFGGDPFDRTVLLVSDKNDGVVYEPLHKEIGKVAGAEDPLIPIGAQDPDGKWSELHVDGAGRLQTVVTGAGSGGTSTTDDGPFVPGTDAVTPAGFFVDEVATDLADEGDVGIARMSPSRVILVREEAADSPQVSYQTQATVAAGGSATLDTPNISVGKTGYLLGVVVSASVPFRAELQTVSNGLVGSNPVVWFASNRGWDFRPPGRKFIKVAHDTGAGLDGFRVVIVNLDASEAADVHACFFYDEA